MQTAAANLATNTALPNLLLTGNVLFEQNPLGLGTTQYTVRDLRRYFYVICCGILTRVHGRSSVVVFLHEHTVGRSEVVLLHEKMAGHLRRYSYSSTRTVICGGILTRVHGNSIVNVFLNNYTVCDLWWYSYTRTYVVLLNVSCCNL